MNNGTPYDYLKTTINGISLADAYRSGRERKKNEVLEALKGLGWDRAANDLALYWGKDETA